ncbi:MAG: aldehyde dehydrogenase family protein, partial [Anaerolineae bacterium]
GGRPRPDLGPTLYEPTLLSGVTPEMSLHAEEVFGPVAAVHKVVSAEEAIRLANDTPYGLHAGIFTRSRARGERLARQIRAGTVCINDTHTVWSAMDAPMGGVKASGMGRRHGPEGIQQYTDAQTIFVNRLNRQIGGGQTPLSIRAGFMDLLTWALKLWRRIPFLR